MRLDRTCGFVLAGLATTGLVGADERPEAENPPSGFCSATAAALFKACGFEVQDDFAKATAICINFEDEDDREECFDEARAARLEHVQLCRDQRDFRRQACGVIGEGRYDPDFDPRDFDDPRHPTHPNPYFPLRIGNRWRYQGGGEVNELEVLDATKRIDEVDCLVVADLVKEGGDLTESTDDWYAFNRSGDIWYCGEEVKNFESFEGDDPRKEELVGIDGSFKAGRNHDKPGVIFQASPREGESYVEEFSLGNAEDVTDVLSTRYRYGADHDLDRFVPARLAHLMCAAGDCVVTRNYSLLEPGVFGRKYYAKDIGVFLEVNPDTGEVHRLVACNFDPRCQQLALP
jgi:hypothetical protein